MDNTLQQMEQQLPQQILAWETGLRAGYSVLQVLEASAADGPDPLAGEVKQVLADVASGTALAEALKHWANRQPGPGLQLVVATMLAQREVGGNLADILQVVGHVLEKRQGQTDQ